eukprot:5661268-Pyramimonas_sp.AAC.1
MAQPSRISYRRVGRILGARGAPNRGWCTRSKTDVSSSIPPRRGKLFIVASDSGAEWHASK